MSRHASSARAIVEALGGELIGDGDVVIDQVAPLERATPREIGFIVSDKYLKALDDTQAGAVILPRKLADAWAGTRIVVDDPYLYFARVSQLLNPLPVPAPGVHPSAVVLSPLSPDASVAAQAFVDEDCVIGAGVVIGPGCVIERGCRIGAGTFIHSRVVLKHACEVGERCILHSGAVIGSDGFGIAKRRDGSWEKIPQIGRVLVGDDVEIGANACIDRGALDDTVIENGAKLDNLVHIAHNCRIGQDSAIAALVGIAGSTRIGRRVIIGGASGVAGHVEIGDDITVTGHASVTKSLVEKGAYSSVISTQPHAEWLRNAAYVHNLDKMAERIKKLEKRLKELENKT
ncbi:UDP-3-O-(3-hydroxymyristoyl)glucosamine N-acyltransferase [Uliginosibacterium sp. H1]|uniref:UDP-3-O-(3-hydroxymyristoyl)glucosamine N-acyltransferase n=1 Tax=Uliginosibacterium sp. H1 TaxID=3114757 RepID=UPI002E176B3E|nr:UDP-3-O-(3-hydroxymyristoyl)glucosamine N-acyltransferase [Uliginosibacterium sp. H1]